MSVFWVGALTHLTSSSYEDQQENKECINFNSLNTKLEKNRKQIKGLVASMQIQNQLLQAMADKMGLDVLSKDPDEEDQNVDIEKTEHLEDNQEDKTSFF